MDSELMVSSPLFVSNVLHLRMSLYQPGLQLLFIVEKCRVTVLKQVPDDSSPVTILCLKSLATRILLCWPSLSPYTCSGCQVRAPSGYPAYTYMTTYLSAALYELSVGFCDVSCLSCFLRQDPPESVENDARCLLIRGLDNNSTLA